MNVKKGSRPSGKGRLVYPKRLRTLFFPYNFSVKPLLLPFGVQRYDVNYAIAKRSSPPKILCKSRTQGGPIFFTFHFIMFLKWFWDSQNPNFPSAFLKCCNCFIPRRDLRKQNANGVHLRVVQFYCVLETVLTISKSELSMPYWNLGNVLSPEGT